MKKIKVCGLLFGGLLYLMTSCLGSDKLEYDEWSLANAQISSFMLFSDSIDGLSNVKFTIDQINGKIYNKVPMPFGTDLSHKVFCELAWDEDRYGNLSSLFVSHTNDSVWWASNADSIDFSAPLKITVYPPDGLTPKIYEAQINVHQVDPYEMVWQNYDELTSGSVFNDIKVIPFNGSYYMYALENGVIKLYKSDTEKINDWMEMELSGFPNNAVLSQITENEGNLYVISEDGSLYFSSADADQNSTDEQSWSRIEGIPAIKSLLGYLSPNIVTGRVSVVSGISLIDGTMRFISINKTNEWETGAAVPSTFPVSGFGSINYETMYNPRISVVAGRDSDDKLSNKVWATMDGLSWALMSDGVPTFSPREGIALSFYNKCFFVIGGIDSEGTVLKDIHFSIDHGINWFYNYFEYPEDMEEEEYDEENLIEKFSYELPEEYMARGFNSVIIDDNNYMLLFGGKESKDTNVLNEIWRGRINRLGFGKE